jgi:hypothetical protein
MPHLIESAPTGRAKCRGCGQPIAKGDLRLGERLPNPFADTEGAETTHWFHLACAAFKRPEPLLEALGTTSEEITDRGTLEAEAALGVAHRRLVRADAASLAPSGRAACRSCKEPIGKGTWRIALVFYEDGRFSPSGYIHAGCARAYFETLAVMPRLRHFSSGLAEADFADLAARIGADPA